MLLQTTWHILGAALRSGTVTLHSPAIRAGHGTMFNNSSEWYALPVSYPLSANVVRQNEKWTPPADNHDTAGQFDPAVHSLTGINSVSLQGFPHPFDPRIIATTQENPTQFPFNLDQNSGSPLGVGK